MYITATQLNKRPGEYLMKAYQEPVIVEKSGRPSIVMVSYEKYLELEDAYWGEQALLADKEKSLSAKETEEFLKSDE